MGNRLTDSSLHIVSGGQTGADRAGLDWAIARGLELGGWCPKGRRSEDGLIPPQYPLDETLSAGYQQRTKWNVRDSDATVIFTLKEELDGGSELTARLADSLGRPWLHFRAGVHERHVVSFLECHDVRILNIAGKRESAAPGIYRFTFDALERAFALS